MRNTLALLLLSLLTACSGPTPQLRGLVAPLPPQKASLTSNASMVTANIKWYRGGQLYATFEGGLEPVTNGVMAREVMGLIAQKSKPADEVKLIGSFNFGKSFPLLFPPCTISGYGPNLTELVTNCKIDKTGVTKPSGTPGFLVGPGATTFRDLTLTNECYDPNEDGGCLGNNIDGPLTLTVDHCVLNGAKGCDWLLYSWSGGTKTINVTDTELYFARQGIAMCGSGDNAHVVTVTRCRFFGDANGSTTFGESSGSDPNNGGLLGGIVLRGGTLAAYDNQFWLTGLAKPYTDSPNYGCPRLAAITDQYWKPGRADSKFTLARNVTRNLTPGNASQFYDIDIRSAPYSVIGNGSGVSGEYLKWTPPTATQ